APPAPAPEPLDRSMLAGLADVVEDATAAFQGYDHTRALERTERFFWDLCDDYLELVKARAYDADSKEGASARAALLIALSVLHRLFAPFLPFVAEEVWSWWRNGSVHAAAWPSVEEFRAAADEGDPAVLAATAEVLRVIRKAKSEAKLSMRAEVDRVAVHGKQAGHAGLCRTDIAAAGRVAELIFQTSDDAELRVDVALPDAEG
ncbi:class I tRNA ligase family protein, partial [Thermobifida halotolerans]|uniref:class I tRNA ligase family protein n=1 Tax=Thermobifida halotolerans TaxID=483545 RepID=UPI001F314B0F